VRIKRCELDVLNADKRNEYDKVGIGRVESPTRRADSLRAEGRQRRSASTMCKQRGVRRQRRVALVPGTALSEAMLRRHRGRRDKERDRHAEKRELQ
jgi:hypothetical protein